MSRGVGEVTGWSALRSVARRQLSVGVGIVAARACGFVTGAVVARGLGVGGFGRYTVAFTVFSSLLQLTSFADTWLVSRWADAEQRPAIVASVRRVKLEVALATCAAAALFSLLALSVHRFGGATLAPVALAVATAAAASFTTTLAAVGQAERNVPLFTAAVAAPPLLTLIASAATAAARVDRPLAFIAALLVGYAPLAVSGARLMRDRPIQPTRSMRVDILAFGGWVTLGTIFYAVFQRVDVFFLSSARPVSDVGLYGAAVRLSAVGALGASIVSTALMPVGSLAATWRSARERRAYVRESVIAISGIAACLAIGIAITPLLVTRVFGAAFADAVPAARVLLTGQLVLGAQMPFYFALYALGGQRWIAAISFAQLATACLGGWLLIRPFGIIGAAWSNTLTYFVGAIGVAWFLGSIPPAAEAP